MEGEGLKLPLALTLGVWEGEARCESVVVGEGVALPLLVRLPL